MYRPAWAGLKGGAFLRATFCSMHALPRLQLCANPNQPTLPPGHGLCSGSAAHQPQTPCNLSQPTPSPSLPRNRLALLSKARVHSLCFNPLPFSKPAGTVTLGSSGWADAVLWTPWTAMEACYKEFVCVENAQFGFVALKVRGSL